MSDWPAVSILLPVFNAQATLEAAVHSVQAQTFPDWELLVVDDGSTDATPEMAAGLAARDGRIRLVRQPRGGIVEAPLAHPAVLFRRAVWQRHGGYRGGPFPEDYELWLRWLAAGVQMAKVPRKLVVWNDRPGRLSRTDPRYSPRAFYWVKARYLARELHERLADGRPLWIWGAGRTSRQRAELLATHGLTIRAYVDIDPRKIGQTIHNRPVHAPQDLPGPERCFVVSYVGSRGARELIRHQLQQRGYRPVVDFYLAG